MFSDIKMVTEFLVDKPPVKSNSLSKLDYDKFKLKFFKKIGCAVKTSNRQILSNNTVHTSLKLLDIHGEVLIKDLFRSLDSSVGRAKD